MVGQSVLTRMEVIEFQFKKQQRKCSTEDTCGGSGSGSGSGSLWPSVSAKKQGATAEEQQPEETRLLKFECDWKIGIGGSVWTSGQVLTGFLEDHQTDYAPVFHKKTVLELGSGTGFVGLMTAVCFEPKRVFLTDLASHVAILQHNLALNSAQIPSCVDVQAKELTWGNQHHAELLLQEISATSAPPKIDVILGTDVAYLEELYDPLLQALCQLCEVNHTLVLLGLNRADTKLTFFDNLHAKGFEYYKISDDLMKPALQRKEFALFQIMRTRR